MVGKTRFPIGLSPTSPSETFSGRDFTGRAAAPPRNNAAQRLEPGQAADKWRRHCTTLFLLTRKQTTSSTTAVFSRLRVAQRVQHPVQEAQ